MENAELCCKKDEIWIKKMSSSKLVVTRHVERISGHLLLKKPFLTYIARWKLYYLIIRKHHRNWLVGHPMETPLEVTAELEERSLVQKVTDDHVAGLVAFSSGQHFLVSVFNRITAETGYCRYSLQ